MKKYILTFFVIFFICTSWTYAAGSCPDSCKISDWPSPWLSQYFSNLQSVSWKVRSSIGKYKIPKSYNSRTYNRLQKDLIWAYNSVINWNGYFSTFDYYVTLPLSQSVPTPLKRDHEMVQNQLKRLNQLLETIVKRWASDEPVKDACQWIDDVPCGLTDLPAKQVVVELIKNTEKVGELLRLSILWEPEKFIWDFLLVKPNFREEISMYYNKTTAESCARCESTQLNGWTVSNFMSTFSFEKQMNSIFSFNKLWKNGIQRWKDAWNLLTGNVSDEKYRLIERQVLARELSKQWLNGEQSAIILRNLDKYNENGGYSLGNNFLANSFNDPLGKKLEKTFYDFNDAVAKAKEKYWEQPIPFVEINTIQENVQSSGDIEKQIAAFYNSELPFAQILDDVNGGLLGKLVTYHQSLTEVIKWLDTIIPDSCQVCSDQCSNVSVPCCFN